MNCKNICAILKKTNSPSAKMTSCHTFFAGFIFKIQFKYKLTLKSWLQNK